jgi:hypothetical protein
MEEAMLITPQSWLMSLVVCQRSSSIVPTLELMPCIKPSIITDKRIGCYPCRVREDIIMMRRKKPHPAMPPVKHDAMDNRQKPRFKRDGIIIFSDIPMSIRAEKVLKNMGFTVSW